MCQSCGASYQGKDDNCYCPKCAKEKKLDTVVKIRTCKDCGIEFYGGPRAIRCPECSHRAKIENSKRHQKVGTMRLLGSIDKCVICGNDYIVKSGRQKYCSEECQRIGVLEWQKEHKKGYNKKSGQYIKSQERRKNQKKICVYCLKPFKSSVNSNLCSEYCRKEHSKIQMCESDIKRGRKRNLQKLLDAREEYREKVKQQYKDNPGE